MENDNQLRNNKKKVKTLFLLLTRLCNIFSFKKEPWFCNNLGNKLDYTMLI